MLIGHAYSNVINVPASSLGIAAPFEVPDEYFIAKKLNPHVALLG
ncbi:hypothetical protein [Enterococcus cecorum]|nr:hypothetical protein [Enterococcus cecorum]